MKGLFSPPPSLPFALLQISSHGSFFWLRKVPSRPLSRRHRRRGQPTPFLPFLSSLFFSSKFADSLCGGVVTRNNLAVFWRPWLRFPPISGVRIRDADGYGPPLKPGLRSLGNLPRSKTLITHDDCFFVCRDRNSRFVRETERGGRLDWKSIFFAAARLR